MRLLIIIMDINPNTHTHTIALSRLSIYVRVYLLGHLLLTTALYTIHIVIILLWLIYSRQFTNFKWFQFKQTTTTTLAIIAIARRYWEKNSFVPFNRTNVCVRSVKVNIQKRFDHSSVNSVRFINVEVKITK